MATIKYTMGLFHIAVSKYIQETSSIIDSSSIYILKHAIIDSTMQVHEGVTKSLVASRSFQETSNLIDAYSIYTEKPRVISSTVQVHEGVLKNLVATRFISEGMELSDSGISSMGRTRYKQEDVSIVESVLFTVETPRYIFDTETISESVSVYIYDAIGKVLENINISESSSVSLFKNEAPQETLSIVEQSVGFVVTPTYKQYAETLSITDSGSYVIFNPLLIPNEETLNISDVGLEFITKYPAHSTELSITDASDVYINTLGVGSTAKSYSSAVTILESLQVGIYKFKTAAKESLNVQNTHHSIKYENILIELRLTTSFISADSTIVPVYSVGEASQYYVGASHSSVVYSSVLVGNKRDNIHQIKTDPEGAELDFGFIKEDVLKDFTIISGEPYDLTITDILIPAFFGVILVGLGVGDTLVAGQDLDFQVLAYSDVGRDEIDDFLTIKFAGGQQVKIFIKIIRVVVFDLFITPDRGSYQESISYYTAIFNSMTNVRKSKVMMEVPKHSVKYGVTVFQTFKHRAYLNIFRKGLVTPILHPLWGEALYLDYFEDSTFWINAAWEDCSYAVGDTVFVFEREDYYRLATVVALEGERMLLNRRFDIREGFVVTPSFVGMVTGTVDTSHSGERYATGTITVDEIELDA